MKKTYRNDEVVAEVGAPPPVNETGDTLHPADFTPTALAVNAEVVDDNNLRPFRATITALVTPTGLPVNLPVGEIHGEIKRNGTKLTVNFVTIADASTYTGTASTTDSAWVWKKAANGGADYSQDIAAIWNALGDIDDALDAINGEGV